MAAVAEPSEVHLEHLLGRRVRDVDGSVVGQLEEFRVEIVDGEPVVLEFHIGAAALLERVGVFGAQLPFFSWLAARPREFRVPWQLVDLTDPRQPRLRVREADLVPAPHDTEDDG